MLKRYESCNTPFAFWRELRAEILFRSFLLSLEDMFRHCASGTSVAAPDTILDLKSSRPVILASSFCLLLPWSSSSSSLLVVDGDTPRSLEGLLPVVLLCPEVLALEEGRDDSGMFGTCQLSVVASSPNNAFISRVGAVVVGSLSFEECSGSCKNDDSVSISQSFKSMKRCKWKKKLKETSSSTTHKSMHAMNTQPGKWVINYRAKDVTGPPGKERGGLCFSFFTPKKLMPRRSFLFLSCHVTLSPSPQQHPISIAGANYAFGMIHLSYINDSIIIGMTHKEVILSWNTLELITTIKDNFQIFDSD